MTTDLPMPVTVSIHKPDVTRVHLCGESVAVTLSRQGAYADLVQADLFLYGEQAAAVFVAELIAALDGVYPGFRQRVALVEVTR